MPRQRVLLRRVRDGLRGWLTERYETIDALNEAWTTSFWMSALHLVRGRSCRRGAHRFSATRRNGSTSVVFLSTSCWACFLAEKSAIRAVDSAIPITTNFIGLFEPLDYWKWLPRSTSCRMTLSGSP